MDVPIHFILNTEMASEFRMKPVKLERVDIEIPGVDIYSQHKKFKKRRIVLSSLAVKSLKGINFLFNYIVNEVVIKSNYIYIFISYNKK